MFEGFFDEMDGAKALRARRPWSESQPGHIIPR